MKIVPLIAAAVATLASAGVAQANITPALTGVTSSGVNFLYTYQVTLDSDQGLVSGSKTAIFDFAGYIPGSVTSSSALFAASTELQSMGMLLANPSFTDDPNVTNLTLTWTDGPFNTSGGPFPETNFTLTALSSYRTTAFDGYSSRAVKNSGNASGQATFNVGPVEVPFAAVPEPESWALMIIGFGGVGALVRNRRRPVFLTA